MKLRSKVQVEAAKRLRRLMKKGTTVYTVLRHVSKSGMRREISPIVVRNRGRRVCDFTGLAANALGSKEGKHEGVVVHGAGMDMGFHMVYELAHVLHGDGYALEQRWL